MFLNSFNSLILWFCLAGCTLVCADDDSAGSVFGVVYQSVHAFRYFHKCIIDTNSTNSTQHDDNERMKCYDAEQCFEKLYYNSEGYLTSKLKKELKEVITIGLNLVSDCFSIFSSSEIEYLQSQLVKIEKCVNQKTTGNLCEWLKRRSYCLEPDALNCKRCVFSSILQQFSLGWWESLGCLNSSYAFHSDWYNSKIYDKNILKMVRFNFENDYPHETGPWWIDD